MQNLKFTVVGLGSMGKRRVRNLLANGVSVNHIKGVDCKPERASEASDKYGIQTYAELSDEIIKFSDAFIISTPPDQHLLYAKEAAENNIHMFIEASVLSEGLEELAAQVREKKLIAFPSCTMRFFPGPKKVNETITSGKIGKVLAWQYQSGQYLPDWHPWESIKDFYVSNPLTGGCREIVPFEMVWLEPVFGKVVDVDARHAKLSDMPAEIEDIYMLQLRHESGTLGQLIVDVLGRTAIRYLRVTGSKGTLEWDDSTKKVRVFSTNDNAWHEENFGEGTVESNYINPEEPYIEEIGNFIDCIASGKEPLYTLENDVDILNILYKAEKADNENKRVKV